VDLPDDEHDVRDAEAGEQHREHVPHVPEDSELLIFPNVAF
jgi:hypothetical protein